MKCPGQDMQYWLPSAIFDAPCPICGAPVEFFRDENARRCSKCGHRFPNPKIDLACAAWCKYGDQCLSGAAVPLEGQVAPIPGAKANAANEGAAGASAGDDAAPLSDGKANNSD